MRAVACWRGCTAMATGTGGVMVQGRWSCPTRGPWPSPPWGRRCEAQRMSLVSSYTHPGGQAARPGRRDPAGDLIDWRAGAAGRPRLLLPEPASSSGDHASGSRPAIPGRAALVPPPLSGVGRGAGGSRRGGIRHGRRAPLCAHPVTGPRQCAQVGLMGWLTLTGMRLCPFSAASFFTLTTTSRMPLS